MLSHSQAEAKVRRGFGIRRRALTGDRGSVSAEFAVALPAVVLLLALCISALQLTTRQGRAQDAAAVGARLAARGESGSAGGAVAGLLPGATLTLDPRGAILCATVSVSGPPGPLAGIRVSAMSCAPVAE